MPHGVGHHHGGGGGVHHHHHLHRHHLRYRHRDRFGYYSSPYYGYRRRPCSWVIFSVFLTVGIILSTTFTVRYTATDDYDDNDITYNPTDTRIISVSNTLCERLLINIGYQSDFGYDVILYSLNSPPQLSSEKVIQTSLVTSYDKFIHFLPCGANFTMSACLFNNTKEPSYMFYIVKGTDNYDDWYSDHDKELTERQFKITTLCEEGNDSHSYSVESDDFYYLAFQPKDNMFETLNVTLTFERMHYEVDNRSVVDSCFLDSLRVFSVCSVGVPLSGGSLLLQIAPNDLTDITWSDQVTVNAYCSARIWMYVVFSLVVLVGVVLFLVVLTIMMYCCCLRKRRTIGSTVAPNGVVVGEQSVNTPLLHDGTIPPLPDAEVAYPQNSYGSNYYAPPAYKE